MKTCIVIPMYNEEQMASKCLSALLEYAHELPDTHIAVVNDGSSDRTVDEVTPFTKQDRLPVTLIEHEQNQGYGAALKTGIKFAIENGFDYTLFMDSDLTNHPKYLKGFYDAMREGYEYIKATRYSLGGGVEGVPRKSYLFSRAGNIVARILFGAPINDLTNGFRAVRTSFLEGVDLTEPGFAIIMEELYHVASKQPRFAEVPYVLTSRGSEEGTSSFAYTPLTIKQYLSYALRRARDRAFGRDKVTERSSTDNVPML